MNDISIRSLQHYLYCPHRWGLIEIDRAWVENYFVARGNIVHGRAPRGACELKSIYIALTVSYGVSRPARGV